MPVDEFRFRAMLYQCRAEKHEDRARGEVPAQGFVEDDDTGEHREHRNQVCHGRGCGRAGIANDAVLQYIGQPGADNAENEYRRQGRR